MQACFWLAVTSCDVTSIQTIFSCWLGYTNVTSLHKWHINKDNFIHIQVSLGYLHHPRFGHLKTAIHLKIYFKIVPLEVKVLLSGEHALFSFMLISINYLEKNIRSKYDMLRYDSSWHFSQGIYISFLSWIRITELVEIKVWF